MNFLMLPVLDTMAKLYASPRDGQRFDRYLRLLQGHSKDDMLLPIGGYNPMGNVDALAKVTELLALNGEALMQQALRELATDCPALPELTIQVAINVADNLGGA